jgi:hypothetical protein
LILNDLIYDYLTVNHWVGGSSPSRGAKPEKAAAFVAAFFVPASQRPGQHMQAKVVMVTEHGKHCGVDKEH